MTNDKLERVALTFCHSGKFACDGRCAPICFEFAGHKPKRCAHAVRVHGDLATAAIAACEAEAGERERVLTARLCETQMLLVRYGDHEKLQGAAKTWREADRAFEGRCLDCGGLHLGMAGDCMGPPTPSRPHPHAGRMQG